MICCYGLVIGSAVSDLLLRFGYGLVIGSAVCDLLLRFGYWQHSKCVICCYGLVIGSAVSVLSVATVWLLAAR